MNRISDRFVKTIAICVVGLAVFGCQPEDTPGGGLVWKLNKDGSVRLKAPQGLDSYIVHTEKATFILEGSKTARPPILVLTARPYGIVKAPCLDTGDCNPPPCPDKLCPPGAGSDLPILDAADIGKLQYIATDSEGRSRLVVPGDTIDPQQPTLLSILKLDPTQQPCLGGGDCPPPPCEDLGLCPPIVHERLAELASHLEATVLR